MVVDWLFEFLRRVSKKKKQKRETAKIKHSNSKAAKMSTTHSAVTCPASRSPKAQRSKHV